VPGEIRQVDITLTDISHVFLRGHQIRLQVSGGAHPRYARNLGSEADLVHGTVTAPVLHQVQHTGLHPSALVLPVVQTSLAAEASADITATATAHSEVPSALPSAS
jgi:predicted acyl esterase